MGLTQLMIRKAEGEKVEKVGVDIKKFMVRVDREKEMRQGVSVEYGTKYRQSNLSEFFRQMAGHKKGVKK
jgi:hypothetical protein